MGEQGRFNVTMKALEDEVTFDCDAHVVVMSDHGGNVRVWSKYRSGRDIALLGEAMDDMEYLPHVRWTEQDMGKVVVTDRIEGEEVIREAKGLCFIGLKPGEEEPIICFYRVSHKDIDLANELLGKMYFNHVTSEDGKEEESGWTL